MAHTKEHLIELIEAYAVAKATNNAILSALAAGALQQILVAVTFVDPPTDVMLPDDFEVPESGVSAPTRRSRKAAD